MFRSFSKLSRGAIGLGLAVFVVVLATSALVVALRAGESHGATIGSLITPPGDAVDYVSLAHTMLDSHRFALSPQSPPEFFRTPGYPLFIAAILAIFHSTLAVPFVQVLLIAASSVLIFLLGERAFSRTVGIAAALIFSLDPSVLLNSLVTLTESLFTFLLLLAVYVLFDGRTSVRRAFFVGLIIGALTLTRPVGEFLLPLFLAYFIWNARGDRQMCIRGAIALILGAALLVTPWLMRNEHLSGHTQLSSISTYNMLFYNVVEFEVQKAHISKEAFIQQLFVQLGTNNMSSLRTFDYQKEKGVLVWKYIGPHILSYAVFHVEKTIPFFIGSSINDTDRALIDMHVIDVPQTQAVNVSALALSGNVGAVFAVLRAHPFETTERIFWLLVCMFSAVLVLAAIVRRDTRLPRMLFFVSIVGLLAILVGPIAETRYRIPAEPFILLLAFEGLRQSIVYLREKRTTYTVTE